MRLESQECKVALALYPAKNKLEELAVRVLMADYDDTESVIEEVCELPHGQISELSRTIKEIKRYIGIEGA